MEKQVFLDKLAELELRSRELLEAGIFENRRDPEANKELGVAVQALLATPIFIDGYVSMRELKRMVFRGMSLEMTVKTLEED